MIKQTINIDQFINNLSKIENSQRLTNLYRGNSNESLLRRNNLKLYLETMKIINPSILLVGEAPGYKGCRLTGILFTSEKIIKSNSFFKNQNYKFLNDIKELEGEQSATIVWNALENIANKPLIWNIVPFHPHKTNEIKTNRTPTKKELEIGKKYLKQLIQIFEIKKIIAVGRKAESQISNIGIEYVYVRHPANGGKKDFISGLRNEIA